MAEEQALFLRARWAGAQSAPERYSHMDARACAQLQVPGSFLSCVGGASTSNMCMCETPAATSAALQLLPPPCSHAVSACNITISVLNLRRISRQVLLSQTCICSEALHLHPASGPLGAQARRCASAAAPVEPARQTRHRAAGRRQGQREQADSPGQRALLRRPWTFHTPAPRHCHRSRSPVPAPRASGRLHVASRCQCPFLMPPLFSSTVSAAACRVCLDE